MGIPFPMDYMIIPIIDLLGPFPSPQNHGRHGPNLRQGARLHRDEPGSSTRQTSFFGHLLGG